MLWILQALISALSLCIICKPWWPHWNISVDLTACNILSHPIVSHRVFCLLGPGVKSRIGWVWACMFLHMAASWCTTSGGLCVCWCRWGFGQVAGIYGTVHQWMLQCWGCQKMHTWFLQWVCHVKVLCPGIWWLLPHPLKISAAGPIWNCTPCSSWLLYIFATIRYMHPCLFCHRWGYNLLWMWRMKYWQCSQELSSEFGLSWSVADVVEPSVWVQWPCQDPAAPQSDHAEVLVVEVVGGGGWEYCCCPCGGSCLFLFPLCGAVWAPASFCWAWGCCVCPLFCLSWFLDFFLCLQSKFGECLLASSISASSVRGLTMWGWCGSWDECTAMGGVCLALAVFAGNFVVFAVKFCMAVPTTSEAHRGFTGVVGLAISSAWSVSVLRLNSIVWHCVVTWGQIWWGGSSCLPTTRIWYWSRLRLRLWL